MKIIYSHTQLLSLRHECQEQSVKSFFATCRTQCVYSEISPNITFPAQLQAMHTSQRPQISLVYSQGIHQGFKPNNTKTPYVGAAALGPKINTAIMGSESSELKGAFASLESFQLVKIPSCLGELPPGSKIIKVSPGIPVPVNAIPISLAEVSNSQSAHTKPVKKRPLRAQTKNKPKCKPTPAPKPKISISKTKIYDSICESSTYDSVTYYSAGSTDDQQYFAATAAASPTQAQAQASAQTHALVPDAGPTRGPIFRASSETKYHYARFFEPYMRKFSGTGPSVSVKNPSLQTSSESKPTPIVAVTPSTSYESESATEYSSDSSNIQIQLPG